MLETSYLMDGDTRQRVRTFLLARGLPRPDSIPVPIWYGLLAGELASVSLYDLRAIFDTLPTRDGQGLIDALRFAERRG